MEVVILVDDLSSETYTMNKTEGVDLNAFNQTSRINKSQTLTKHTLSDCKCKFDGRKYNSNQKWNRDNSRCKCKNLIKHYIWNRSTCVCEINRYLKINFED